MKESARAARDEVAQNRCLAALKKLAGANDERVRELEELRARRLPPAVGAMMEREIMADLLEELAATDAGDPLDESTVQLLVDAGYDTLEKVREASDEELLTIKGIGEKKLAEVREKVG